MLATSLAAVGAARADQPTGITPVTDATYLSQVSSVATLARGVLNNIMGLTPGSPRTYQSGVWYSPGANCYWCLDAAATAAAVISRETRVPDPALVKVAKDTIDGEINQYQRVDGSWDGTGIVTGFVAPEIAMSYLELRDVLDSATAARWVAAVRRAADFIVQSKNLTWYTNGNVNLRNAEVMWLAWKLTGDITYQQYYEQEWAFTMAPPQTRWPGFGLHLTTAPSKLDGSDGAGYLAEAGAGAPGFDAEYTMTQLDTATAMWVLSHDSRWLRLTNLLFNQIRPRIDQSFTLDASGGTRFSGKIPFYSGGLAVLYHSGDRPDLQPLLAGDLSRLLSEFRNTGNYSSVNFYRGLSGWLGMIVLDRQWPGGMSGGSLPAPAP